MPVVLREKLEQQGYHILGQRGAFKACQWQHKSLLQGDVCYKQRFYGIKSHRCLQMTPVVDKCTQSCDFCWRVIPSDIGVKWVQNEVHVMDVLPAEDLLDAAQMANLRSLGGYNPEVNPRIKDEMYQEARNPRHVAISLAGEPTLYPLLNDLIEVIEKRGMTSFLVTNGTRPNIIAEMKQPTQLYVTLAAPDEQTYKRLCRPIEKGAWEKLNQTQEVLQSLSGRRVNRLTMVAEENMHNPRAYAHLILQGEPDFIEVKGYMHLGSSRGRMGRNNVPPHRDIRAFSEKIASLTGYFIQDEQIESRVVLLSHSKQIKKLD